MEPPKIPQNKNAFKHLCTHFPHFETLATEKYSSLTFANRNSFSYPTTHAIQTMSVTRCLVLHFHASNATTTTKKHRITENLKNLNINRAEMQMNFQLS